MSQPSPEVKAIVKEWVDMQQDKYGPDWKEILADEMAEDFCQKYGPVLNELCRRVKP